MSSTPNDAWFYLAGERPVGPMSEEQLRAAVLAGVVRPETMVRKASWPQWYLASQLPGLFPQQQGVPPGQVAPASVAPVPSPGPPPGTGFNIQTEQSDRPQSDLQRTRRKRSSNSANLLLILGTTAVGLAVAIGLWLVLTREPEPAKKSVAKAPEELDVGAPWNREFEKRKPRKETDDDFSTMEWNPDADSSYNQSTFDILEPPTPNGKIDDLVFAKWKELEIEPANQCSDGVFLRRVYLDVIGTLPTVEEARGFLEDKDPDKRAKLIDALLERPEFADFWAMKWCDLLRVKAEFPINLWPNAAQAYHHWIREAIKTNMPYDKFVREMLTSSGSNFRVPQVNFYRALQSKEHRGIAVAVALTFMGSRAEGWPAERLAGLSGFFLKVGYKSTGEWKEEIIYFDPHKKYVPPPVDKSKKLSPSETMAKSDTPPKPVFPDGTPAEIAPNKDPREVFADWLTSPKNPWFAKNVVNRIWHGLQGRGIIHEPDDIRPDNPASNLDLLKYLEDELVSSKYDLRHIYRLILNSSTYQLSSIPKSKHPEAAIHFASYTVRRLEAEVIIDALNQLTGTTEFYKSIIPEPYTFIPKECRAIALPDGSITSSFLELFGRPARDSGLVMERNNNITSGQRLHLLNSSHIRNKLQKGPGMKKLLSQGNTSETLYLAILSRLPGDGEGGSGSDLAWTLINSTEFLFRH